MRPETSVDRRRIEDELRKRNDQARRGFEAAQRQFDATLDEVQRKELPGADGAYALKAANDVMRAARREWATALRQFTAFIAHGKLPPDWHGPRPSQE